MTVPINYTPGDWPEVWAETAQGKLDQTEQDGLFPADVDGYELGWVAGTAQSKVGAPSTVTPDLQGNQATKTPYVNLHLFP
jgi:hypothetical protein